MINFPVVLIPPKVETWRVDGAIRDFSVMGCGNLPYHGRGLKLLGFQGSGILNRRYVRDIEDARLAIAHCFNAEDVRHLMRNARGSISLQLFDPRGNAVYLFNDPLGGAPIYHYKGEACEAYSSDLGSLVSAIRFRQDKLRSEPKYFAAGYLTATHSYGAASPYKEIDVLRRGVGVKIDANADVMLLTISSREELYTPPPSYEQGLELLRQELTENVRIAASATGFDQRYSHLTAGFDSRLVLSAIRNQRLEDLFQFSCIEKSADWEIAGNLAADLGLQFAADRSQRGTGWASNYFESITRTARRSYGAIVSGLDPALIPENCLQFQGGYGEVGRTFNSFRWNGDQGQDGLGYQMWQYANYPKAEARAASIWADKFMDETASNVLAYASEASALGLQKDFATNYIYVEGRNRHWIGLQSYYSSGVRSQFDPLYSKALVSTPALLDFESRKANFLGFDLMRSLSPDLLEYPFDKPRVGWLYQKERGQIPQRTFSGKQTEVIRGPAVKAKPWPGKVDTISERDVETSKAMGLSSMLIFGVRNYGADAIKMATDSDELRSIYRVDNLRKRWNDGAPQTKADFNAIHNVIATLVLSGHMTEK